MSVNQTLVVTNRASDPDSPAQTLRFSLDTAPSGAFINSSNGVLRWSPSCVQGNSTYAFTVRASDNGLPVNLSATQTFLVTVHECVEASLGNAVVQAGGSNSVAIRLLTTIELTNLSFIVIPPSARFTNFAVHANANLVATPFTAHLANHDFFVNFNLPGDRVLHGPTNVAELSFEALANQTSAFVSLDVAVVVGHKPDGAVVGNAYGYPGRVVVVGENPLLEVVRCMNGQFQLILYALPGTTNRLETTTSLPAQPFWIPWQTNVQASLVHSVPCLSATNRTLFIRAMRQ
jgi:hypothetical protein